MSETLFATTHLLYLHGFRSSPQSFKARVLEAWLREHRPRVHWCCPQLPPSPREALALLARLTSGWPAATSAVIGSSLGGFYATAWAERNDWPLVALNPAVNPARDLAAHIGEQRAFHDPRQRVDFRPEYVDELQAISAQLPAALSQPERCLALIAKGDEVLDWREMHARYAGANVHLFEGGDHALSDFPQHLPTLLRFLQLCE